jgi:hypothetical protein
MAYAALPSKSDGQYFTLANYNTVRDNFAAGVPDIFTTKGDLAAATGADAATRVAVGADDATLVPDASQSAGLAWQIQPAARAYNSANLALLAATWTTLTLNSERFDTDAVHSTVSNTSRLTVPSGGAGLYSIGACVEFDTSAIGVGVDIGIRILLNGTTVLAETYHAGSFAAVDNVLNLSTLYALNVADYVEVQAYTTQACNVNASGNYSPEFWMNWERRQ